MLVAFTISLKRWQIIENLIPPAEKLKEPFWGISVFPLNESTPLYLLKLKRKLLSANLSRQNLFIGKIYLKSIPQKSLIKKIEQAFILCIAELKAFSSLRVVRNFQLYRQSAYR